ncbi:MAG: hypothetical protein ABIS47_02655 [Acidimicrobiales bacterium]
MIAMLHHTDMPQTDAVPPELAPLLAAATDPAFPAELTGEQAAVAAFSATAARPVTPITGATRPPRRRLAGKAAALAAVGAFSLAGATAAAATGSLPDSAQDVAHETLTKVGVDVPQGHGKGLATAPGQLKKDPAAPAKVRGPKPPKPAHAEDEPKTEDPASKGQGGTISSIARDPSLTGAEKGAAVSDAASGGKSHAGDEHPATPKVGGPPPSSPGLTAPGRATASTASPRRP